MAIRITIDYKSQADTWWAAARSAPDAPPAVRPLLAPDGAKEVLVTYEQSTDILMWASELPGWEETLAQKRLPLIFQRTGD